MPTVPIVDDDPGIRKMAALLLQHAGYAVVCASNGLEALMLYSSYGKQVAAIVTDIDMPEMDGIELAARVRANEPGARVLLMTGCMPPGAAVADGWRVLSKPFRPQDLVSAVKEILAGP